MSIEGNDTGDSRFYFGFTLLVLLLSSLCYIYGAWHRVPGAVYTGIRSINASDYNQHLSWIEQMRHGKFFLNNLYTSEPHRPLMVRPVYFLLSLPFGLTNIQNTVVFHILRIACGLILLCFLPSLIRIYDREKSFVRTAFLVLTLTSGLGWLLKSWIPDPVVSIPESILFLSLGEAPHFSFTLLFLWLGIGSLYIAREQPAKAMAVYFSCLVLLWWEHPFDSVTLIALAMINLWRFPNRRTQVLVLAGTVLVSLPAFLFYQALKRAPAFSGWGTIQGLMLSPSLPSLLIAYLPLILFAIPGAVYLWRDPERKKLLTFLLMWIGLQLLLIYIPSSFQRRLISGLQFPFALLAAYGLNRLRSPVLIGVLIVLASIGNASVMSQQIADLRSGQMPYYLPVSYREAFHWLEQQPRQGAVISGFTTGNFIPAYTGFPVYIGHSFVTPDSANKKAQMINFYNSPSAQFLNTNHIRYIFFGLEEQHISRTFPVNLFQKIYENEKVKIFAAPTSH